jgi:lysophospholipase L1-like esterase
MYAFTVTVGIFGVGEIVARQINPALPGWTASDNPSVVMTGHPTRLWGLAPGDRKNVDTVATINEMGLRGESLAVPRPAGKERIAVVGDSSFFGFGIADDETMSSRLDRRWPLADAINAAVPGYSTAQSLLLLDEVVWDLEPSLLVVANFWSDTNYESYSDQDLLQSVQLAQNTVLSSSALVRWMAPWVSQLRPDGGPQIVTWVQGDELPDADQRRVSVQDYARNLSDLAQEAARRDVGMILLTPPSRVEVENKVRPPHQWDPYRTVQKAVARHYGIPHVDMTPVFKAAFDGDSSKDISTYFLDDLHPTSKGQAIMAQLVSRVLQQRGWPTDRIRPTAESPLNLQQFVDTTPPSRAGRPKSDRTPIQNLFEVAREKPNGTQVVAIGVPSVSVQIVGGQPPYMVSARDGDRSLASASVKKAQPVRLRLGGAKGSVTVTGKDAQGQEVSQTVRLQPGQESAIQLSF